MSKINHRFLNHKINPKTEILVIGTFNPDTEENKADFFYSRQRNFLWELIPAAFNKPSLKGESKDKKIKFIEEYRIDFIDLIAEVDVVEESNYDDSYLDKSKIKWRNVISEISKLPNLKKVCLTRKSFGDIPNMKIKIDEIRDYCENNKIYFQFLTTPARFNNIAKQEEWKKFFIDDY